MTPDELRDAGRELYGRYGWQTKIAVNLKTDPRTVRRWVSGETPIPGPAEAAILCFLEKAKLGT